MKYITSYKLFESQVGISDMNKYLTGMGTSMEDKLFWVDKVDYDVVVDFGCADGSLLKKLQQMNPNIKLVGYDVDGNMLRLAKQKLGQNVLLTDDWDEIISYIKDFRNPMVFLSSVIHEVYSYSHPKEVNQFWKRIFSGDFETVVIRDMIPSVVTSKGVNEEDVNKVREKADPYILTKFEKEWGDIGRDYRNFLHFLLKYRYYENFSRELKENYVPVSLETVLKKVPSNYNVVYNDHYVLPFLRQQVKKDFDIEIEESTHAKLIIKKVESVNEDVPLWYEAFKKKSKFDKHYDDSGLEIPEGLWDSRDIKNILNIAKDEGIEVTTEMDRGTNRIIIYKNGEENFEEVISNVLNRLLNLDHGVSIIVKGTRYRKVLGKKVGLKMVHKRVRNIKEIFELEDILSITIDLEHFILQI